MSSDRKKTFLEGFEAGLRAAWNEVIKMASRGYSSTELGVMAKTVREQGERLADEDLSASDLIIPPDDLSLEEAKELFTGEGLIPDLPAA